jgi:hypothetical protein
MLHHLGLGGSRGRGGGSGTFPEPPQVVQMIFEPSRR